MMGKIWSSIHNMEEELAYDPSQVYLYTGPTSIMNPRDANRLGHPTSSSSVPRDVTHVQVHPSVREIPCGTFEKCEALQQIDFAPDGKLEVIGEFAFSKCVSLKSVAIPSTVLSIQKGAFQCCFTLISVEFSTGLVAIGEKAFNDCYGLKNVAIPSTVNEIGDGAFKDLKLEKFAKNASLEVLTDVLKTRFDELPVHELCYYYHQGYNNNPSTLEKLTEILAEDSTDGNQGDIFGMTPLHIAALSAQPNLELLRVLLQRYPKTMLVKDEWGNLPLNYAIRSDTPVEAVKLLVEAQEMEFPDEGPYWKVLIPLAINLALLELTKYLVLCSISKRLKALKLPAWRQDVLDMIESIPADTSRSRRPRQRHVKSIETKLMWYEWKEKLSLLEMALWQSKLKQAAGSVAHVDWIDRSRCHVNCGDQVVISNVLPFLGKYDEQEKKKKSIPLMPTPNPRATYPALRHL
jgi:hypothetical protein